MKASLQSACLLSLIALAMLLTPAPLTAQSEVFLHSFNNNGKDGYQPQAGLVSDAAGNFFGVTTLGGASHCGTVFELSPAAGGGWAETILHSFHGTDGRNPDGTLIFDAAGNLYGTTAAGGANNWGTVFELSPNAGAWTEKVLYSFGANSNDGRILYSGVTMDAAGNLYGVTNNGGTLGGAGTVFELSPSSTGTWSETILVNFNYTNGYSPQGPLILDSAGNLYGVTYTGGANGNGLVYELSPSSAGWTETILYNFTSTDPAIVAAGLTMDSAGNLYGTGSAGGAFNDGAVFELSPSGGTWTETILYSFDSSLNGDGKAPKASLTLDASGNLYGTTSQGGGAGCSGGCGTVFRLTASGGSWTEKVLHRFGSGTDGRVPLAKVLLDASGNLYGTTSAGGAFGVGTAFEIKP